MPQGMSEHTHPEHENDAAASEHEGQDGQVESHEVEPQEVRREEFGQSGIEYVVLMRRPDSDWELYDGNILPDPESAAQALADATDDLATRAARLWEVLKATPDSEFMEVAADYERSKGARAALFARAVSSFVVT